MKSKIFTAITIVLFIGFLFVETQAQSRLDLRNKLVKNELLVKILNDSEMKELEPPSPTARANFLRLYSMEGELGDNCAPEAETEITCSFKYYLAVNSGDLGVSGAVYDLGEVGEITKVEWLQNSNRDFDRLRLEISNYPEFVFEYNPKLVRKTRTVEIEVSLQALKIKVIK